MQKEVYVINKLFARTRRYQLPILLYSSVVVSLIKSTYDMCNKKHDILILV